jgi:hypothetical protein
MVQKTFSLYSETAPFSSLFVEVGKNQLTFWTKGVESGKVHALELFEFEYISTNDFGEIFREIKLLSKLAVDSYKDVNVIWENEECLLVPAAYATASSGEVYLEAIYGVAVNDVLVENKEEEVSTIFRVNKDSKDVISRQYPFAKHIHKYEIARNLVKDGSALVFYRDHFLMAIAKDGNLLLMRNFEYETPEDVVYHFIHACTQYNIPVDEMVVTISGLVDTNSALYSELYKYVKVLKVDAYNEDEVEADTFKDYPSHYFSPFFKLSV